MNPPQARARATDPATSHEAALEVEFLGTADTQRRICLAAVLAVPGETAAELAFRHGLERHVPSRRLPELRDAGFIRNGEARICRVMKRASMTWWPEERVEPRQEELF